MTWPWIIAQVLMIVYIRFASWHHAPAVNAMRDYVPTPNPYEDPFHTYSWMQAAVVALCLSLGLLSYEHWAWCMMFGFLCAFWYWLLFDPWLNQGTFRKWYYLGLDSSIDRRLKKRFGKKAGKVKAAAMVFIIILINLLKVTL